MQNWFSEPDSKRFEWGLEFNPALAERHPEINCSLPDQHGGYCPICYDELGEANSFCMECQHTFCFACWEDYLKEKINAGYTGIDSNCMQQNCNLKVGHSVYIKFLENNPSELDKYWKWLTKSLTDENKNIKWCPDPKCQLCAKRQDHSRILKEIQCDCGNRYCFQCGNVYHAPNDCENT